MARLSSKLLARFRLLGAEVQYRQTGTTTADLVAQITGLGKRAGDASPVFRRWLPRWRRAIADVFADEGREYGWPELSPAYAAWKSVNYPNKTLMRRTDRLYNSLVSGGEGAVETITQRTMKKGTRVPYWKAHQDGTATLPARPTLVLPDEIARGLAEDLARWVARGKF